MSWSLDMCLTVRPMQIAVGIPVHGEENAGDGMIFRNVRHRVPGAAIAGCILLTVYFFARHLLEPAKDYSPLLEFMRIENQRNPLYVFAEFEEGFDLKSHKASLTYFEKHPEILKKIGSDLGGGPLQWKLKHLEWRLLFVPESREEFGALYKSYCYDVIADILEKTDLENPYQGIQALQHERPATSSGQGITVFVVHNLAKEYNAQYVFSGANKKKAEIEIGGRFFLGDIGSYSSYVVPRPDGTVEFVRENYTVWQDCAKNPYTALMVPAEETLHIALRPSTDRAIQERLQKATEKKPKVRNQIIEDCLFAEEAIVGGLVRVLFPPILEKYLSHFPPSWIERDLTEKCRLKRYRYLRKGIGVVRNIGYRNALDLYTRNPVAFYELLIT